jgi:hypothetical protein
MAWRSHDVAIVLRIRPNNDDMLGHLSLRKHLSIGLSFLRADGLHPPLVDDLIQLNPDINAVHRILMANDKTSGAQTHAAIGATPKHSGK